VVVKGSPNAIVTSDRDRGINCFQRWISWDFGGIDGIFNAEGAEGLLVEIGGD
jgi:hypothetical protein